MANANYFKALNLGLQVLADVNEIQPLHDEARFNAIKEDAIQLAQTAQMTFFANDKLAAAIVKGALAGIETVTYADVVKPPAAADSTVAKPLNG